MTKEEASQDTSYLGDIYLFANELITAFNNLPDIYDATKFMEFKKAVNFYALAYGPYYDMDRYLTTMDLICKWIEERACLKLTINSTKYNNELQRNTVIKQHKRALMTHHIRLKRYIPNVSVQQLEFLAELQDKVTGELRSVQIKQLVDDIKSKKCELLKQSFDDIKNQFLKMNEKLIAPTALRKDLEHQLSQFDPEFIIQMITHIGLTRASIDAYADTLIGVIMYMQAEDSVIGTLKALSDFKTRCAAMDEDTYLAEMIFLIYSEIHQLKLEVAGVQCAMSMGVDVFGPPKKKPEISCHLQESLCHNDFHH